MNSTTFVPSSYYLLPSRARSPFSRTTTTISHPPRRLRRSSLPLILSLDISLPKQSPSFDPTASALRQAILSVAIGKLGTKSIPDDLIPSLRSELLLAANSRPTRQNLPLLLQRASLLGTLYVKAGHTSAELQLLSFVTNTPEFPTPEQILAVIDTESYTPKSSSLFSYALRLLKGERLTREGSVQLGSLLYATEPEIVGTWPIRVLIAHVMRVRHENAAELSGLAIAASRTLRADWGGEPCGNIRFAHVVEPFDGVTTADMLTPLVCKRLQEVYGMRAVMAVGRSSGPKYGPNLLDVARGLRVPFCRNGDEVGRFTGEFGVAVDQEDCSAGLDGWVEVRKVIVKRPGVATAEKYVDCAPGGSRLFVGSAFHGGYVELMAEAAEGMGFDAYVVVGKGLEGTIGVSVGEMGKAVLLTGWKKKKGGYGREVVEYSVRRDGGGEVLGAEFGPRKGEARVDLMVDRIRRFAREGKSGERMFDARVGATMRALDKALAVLRRETVGLFGEVDEVGLT